MKKVFMFDSGGFKLVAKPLVFEISDMLNTPKGANFGDPGYGSNRYQLIDKPIDALFKMRAFKETAAVILKYFPQLKLERMELLDAEKETADTIDGQSTKSKVVVRCYFKNGEKADV